MDEHTDTNRRSDEDPSDHRRGAKVESRSRFKNALVLIGTFVLVLAAAEGIFRIVYHPENLEAVVRFDETLGWALKPNATFRSIDNQKGLDYLIRTNSLGLRDKTISKSKKPGTKRILIIGDSIAYGTGVDAEWRFSDFLSRALGDDVEIVNAAVCGWGTDQELLFYENKGRELDPDLVILSFTMANDVLNNSLDHLFLGTAPKPRFVLRDGSLTLEEEKLEAPNVRIDHRIKNTLRKSRLLVFAKRRIDSLLYEKHVKQACEKDHGGFDKEGLEKDYSHWSVYERTYGPPFEKAWEVTGALLGRLSEQCAEDGAEFIVFAFPLKLEIDRTWREELLDHFGIDSTLLDFRQPYDRLAAVCADRGIEYVYPEVAFRGASRSRPLYFDRDSHPNAFGHAAAAAVLLGVLHDRFSMGFHIAESDLPYVEPLLGPDSGTAVGAGPNLTSPTTTKN
jgi:hypothetical protein